MLEPEHLSRAANTRLNLIGNDQESELSLQQGKLLYKLPRHRSDTPLALNEFQHNGHGELADR